MQQCSNVTLDCANTNQLVAYEVRIMRSRDIIFGERTCHVVPNLAVVVGECGVLSGEKESSEAVQT
jgi:hypothetical protein